jgi:hypothetical protein
MNQNRAWTVVRFPAGMWSTGGSPDSAEYAQCEVYVVVSAGEKQATKRAQSKRAGLVKKGAALPTQAEPLHIGPSK